MLALLLGLAQPLPEVHRVVPRYDLESQTLPTLTAVCDVAPRNGPWSSVTLIRGGARAYRGAESSTILKTPTTWSVSSDPGNIFGRMGVSSVSRGQEDFEAEVNFASPDLTKWVVIEGLTPDGRRLPVPISATF